MSLKLHNHDSFIIFIDTNDTDMSMLKSKGSKRYFRLSVMSEGSPLWIQMRPIISSKEGKN